MFHSIATPVARPLSTVTTAVADSLGASDTDTPLAKMGFRLLGFRGRITVRPLFKLLET
ncbi:hypothetical protein [Sphingomonas sp. Sphisp140]|uniref:hypothetical protein n=1 Tax=Sphingomonas sp. Sphisp140 TaxID=3243019 RepID=UPI0039B05C00